MIATLAEHRERFPVPPVSYGPESERPGPKWYPGKAMKDRWESRAADVREHGPATAAELGARWGVSRTSARDCLLTLEKKAMVERCGAVRVHGTEADLWRATAAEGGAL